MSDDIGTGSAVFFILHRTAQASAAFDQHTVATACQHTHSAGCECNAVFVVLDLLGQADQHGGYLLG